MLDAQRLQAPAAPAHPAVSTRRKLLGLLALTRFPATLTTAVLVALLAVCNASTPPPATTVVLASLAYLLLSAAGFAINDYFDIEIDTINKPQRPLPAGVLSARTALGIFIGGMLTASAAALGVGGQFAKLTISNIILISVYSIFLKRYAGIIANMFMGVYATLVVLSGLSASGPIGDWVVWSCAALFLYMVGNQIVMCIEDIRGDRELGARTLPVMIGIGKSLALALAFMFVALAILLATIRGRPELVPITAMLAINLGMFWRLIRSPTPETAGRARVFMALTMILTVIVIIVRTR